MFSPKASRGSSVGSLGLSPRLNLTTESPRITLETTVASLEDAVTDSQAKCADLVTDLDCSESSMQHLETIKQLSLKLESMQGMVMRLRTQL